MHNFLLWKYFVDCTELWTFFHIALFAESNHFTSTSRLNSEHISPAHFFTRTQAFARKIVSYTFLKWRSCEPLPDDFKNVCTLKLGWGMAGLAGQPRYIWFREECFARLWLSQRKEFVRIGRVGRGGVSKDTSNPVRQIRFRRWWQMEGDIIAQCYEW